MRHGGFDGGGHGPRGGGMQAYAFSKPIANIE